MSYTSGLQFVFPINALRHAVMNQSEARLHSGRSVHFRHSLQTLFSIFPRVWFRDYSIPGAVYTFATAYLPDPLFDFSEGLVPRLQPTRLLSMQSTTPEAAPVAKALPEEAQDIRDQRKTTETEARSRLAAVDTCTVCRQSIPGKIWMPTNQIRAISSRPHASRELRARALQASRGI